MINNGMFTINKEDWTTPQPLFDALNAKYHFTLDVAASKENTKCAKYFDKETDAPFPSMLVVFKPPVKAG